MSNSTVDASKRTWLIASGCAGAVGAGFTAVPFVSSFQPSERAKAAGAPVEVDISGLQPGQKMTVEWRGKPVWIVRRTKEQVEGLKKLDARSPTRNPSATPTPRPTTRRTSGAPSSPSSSSPWAYCTHLGARRPTSSRPARSPRCRDDWQGGFLCPCHGSTFDLAGRVFKNKPAPDNLEVPPHVYLSDTRLLIGEDKKSA
jgi:ubiquinol-cytochrome c reductase iron-sulfur subunit